MTLSFDECIRFANEHKICSLATCDSGQPRVRVVAMWFADESGFYFSTTTTKRLCKQLKAKPKVEVCFYAPPQCPLGHEGSTDIGTMMRVSGEVIFLEEGSLKQRLLNDRPFLRPSADIQVIFRVQKGEARFWKSEDSGRESTIDTAHF